MKTLKQKICKIAVVMLAIVMLFPKGTEAAENSRVMELTDALHLFASYNIEKYFMDEQYAGRTEYTVNFNQKNMATAAAFSLLNNEISGVEKGNYIEYKLSKVKLKKRSKNLFGISSTASKLSKDKNQGGICFVFQESGCPYIYETIYDSEMDMVKKSFSIKKTDSLNYIATEKLYWGYWGGNTNEPNYKIIYKIKKNRNSSYGYIVKSMKIIRI